MNKTSSIVLVIAVLIIVGGLVFYSSYSSSQNPSTSTSTTITTDNTNQTGTTQSQATLPTVITGGTVVPSGATAVVSGQVNPGGAFTNYWYEYGTTPNLGNKIPDQTVGSGFAPFPAPGYITGLSTNTTYYFRLVAENQYGETTGTQYTFQTTDGTAAPVGSAPRATTLTASAVSRTTMTLNGQVNPNKADTGYWFEYGTTASLGSTSALVDAGNGSSIISASFPLSNLIPDTTYYFRINAENQFGTINGAVLTSKTPGPPLSVVPVVTTQVANPVATTTATVRGTVNPYGAQTTYWFEYGTNSLLESTLVKTTPQKSAGANLGTMSVEASISGLESGTTYYYRIVAQNSAGTVRGDRLSFITQ